MPCKGTLLRFSCIGCVLRGLTSVLLPNAGRERREVREVREVPNCGV